MSITDKRATAGETVTFVFHAVDSSNANITGASDLEIRIWRASDQTLLDFSDDTFGGTVTDSTQTLTEADATNMPGVYYWTKDLSDITNHTTSEDTWVIEARESSGSDLGFTPVGSLTINPPDLIAALYQGAIWIDNANGEASSVLGVAGHPGNPTTTAALATTLSTNTGFKTWKMVDGPLTLNAATYANYRFEAMAPAVDLDTNGATCNLCDFHGLLLNTTSFNANSVANRFYDCAFHNVTGGPRGGEFYRCTFNSPWVVSASNGSGLTLVGCGAGTADANDPPTITFDGDNFDARILDWHGDLTIGGVDASGMNIHLTSSSGGTITLASSCTAGTITVSGLCELSDSSAGSTVVRTGLLRPFEGRIAHALMMGNACLDTITLDGNGHPTSQRLRIWDSSGNVPSSGGGSETTGLLATITLTSTADTSYPTLSSFFRGVMTEA